MAMKSIQAKFAGKCHGCGAFFQAGSMVAWDSITKAVYHPAHVPGGSGSGSGSSVIPAGAIAVSGAPIVLESAPMGTPDPATLLALLQAKKAAKLAKAKANIAAKLAPQTAQYEKAKAHFMAQPIGPGHSVTPPPSLDLTGPGYPKTQKAKGIVALQHHKLLSHAFAAIAFTEETAVEAATAQGFPCFVRPCPITPRHGFVDSRVVKTEAAVRQVWKETKAADPQGELIVMPYVDADYNMVWRPGLLAIGPGHDGATAGHASLSIFLQPQWSHSGLWPVVAADAGVQLEKDDPFLEAVTAGSNDTVITQIRAGVKGIVTGPDWNPEPSVIGDVVTIAEGTKADPDAMLAWESQAKELVPGYHVVYNPGGNLGDHWSVHAQIHKIPVVTSFQPKVGALLPKMGLDLVPLDAQAILWGFLGGMAGPSLKGDLGARKRAVCAAVCGVHHGIRFGGDAGVHIGASVAFLLRLAQAAVWGEARHAEHSGLSRDHVYKAVLDDWLVGRAEFAKKVELMHTHNWHGGFGGKPWAAIGHATMALDRAVLDLLAVPSEATAGALLARLNALVNLAHNNGWFLNKFCEASWFDLAADLDPRAVLMAGPAWYEATTTPADVRMTLLSRLEALTPITVKFAEPNGKEVTAKTPSKSVNMGAGSGHGAGYGAVQASKKLGGISGTFGQLAPIYTGVLAGAQAKVTGSDSVHLQIIVSPTGQYVSGTVDGIPEPVMAEIQDGPDTTSAGGTPTKYFKLAIDAVTGAIQTSEGTVIATVQLKGKA